MKIQVVKGKSDCLGMWLHDPKCIDCTWHDACIDMYLMLTIAAETN